MPDDGCTDTRKGRMLHAYELGLLSEEEAEEFEIHLLECETCFKAVQEFSPRVDVLLHGRQVGQEMANLTEEIAPPPRERSNLRRYLWPDLPLPLRPAVLLGIILLLIYPAYRSLRPSPPPGFRPVQEINLIPMRSSSMPQFLTSRHRDGLIAFLFSKAVPGIPCAVRLLDPDNHVIFADSNYTGCDSLGMGQILFPENLMKPGHYRLTIRQPQVPAAGIQSYEFDVR